MSDRALSAAELLDRAGGPAFGKVTPAQLEQFLTRGELGKVVDDRVVVSHRARALVDMLRGPVAHRNAPKPVTRLG